MAELPPHREDHFPGNAFPPAGGPWGVIAVPFLQRSLSPPTPNNYAGIPQNTTILPVNQNQLGGDREVITLPVEHAVAQGRPQHLHHMNIDAGHHHVPPANLAVPPMRHDVRTNDYAGVFQGVPAQVQVIAPPAAEMREYDVLGGAAQDGPASPGPHGPFFAEPEAVILRRLASRYLYDPDSQVVMVGVELGPASGFRVTISLDIQAASFL